MGLEGIEGTEKMEKVDLLTIEGSSAMSSVLDSALSINFNLLGPMTMQNGDIDGSTQLQVLMQAQALLKKSCLYQKIDLAVRRAHLYQTNPQDLPQKDDEDRVTRLQRDTAINNLRFLNIFYGFKPATFALATNLLDRLLSRVTTHAKYLSCIATTCFYIAAKTQEDDMLIPGAVELCKLSQCGGQAADLLRMEHLILEKLQYDLTAVTPLTFLQYFYDLFASKAPQLEDNALRAMLVAKLEVLVCHASFMKYRSDTVALALLSCVLQDLNLLEDYDLYSTIIELQYYCQMSDCEFVECRGMILDYLMHYCTQRSKLPRLQLVWTVSRRTLHKMRPSQRILLDLEPIMEDEGDENEDSDDAGPFDSENENDGELTGQYTVCTHNSTGKMAGSHKMGIASGNKAICPLQDKCAELSFMLLHSKDDM